MNRSYTHARFLVGARSLAQMPADRGREVAFAGRSNAGKSSAINAITGIGRLARVSKTPGCTQQLNFFELHPDQRLVDLPGYGFARAPGSIIQEWRQLLTRYLQHRRSLAGVVLTMDVRHPLRPGDVDLLDWCHRAGVATHVLLSKADKLSHGAGQGTLAEVRRQLQQHHPAATAQLFSARLKTGTDAARQLLSEWLEAE